MMQGSFHASSFHPPAINPGAAATATPARYPDWVLLDMNAYFANVENATTASTTDGRALKVTFCLADPPAVSHFCVHGPGFRIEDFDVEPRVVFSEKDLVLLRFAFTTGPRSTVLDCHQAEYFIYKAGRGKPSLTPIPATPPGTRNSLYVGIVPCNDSEFFLADLSVTRTMGYYDVSIFSSKMNKWTTRRLELLTSGDIRPEDQFIVTHKVIALGGGVIAWVDLWRGIIVCNILDDDPFIYFIPLPKPGFNLYRDGYPVPVRDVTSCNGIIKFVEMDHLYKEEVIITNNNQSKRFKVMKDLDSTDIMYDSELLLLPQEELLEEQGEEVTYVPDGWKIRTCFRHTSWDNWRKGHNIHVDDILVNNPRHSILLPQLFDGRAGKSTLRNLITAFPCLSTNGDDVVYLMSKVEFYDKNAWIVGVDLGKQTVEMLEPYSAERARCFRPDFLPCAFSEFLNTTSRSCAEEATAASNVAQNRLHDLVSSGNPLNMQPMSPVLNTDAHGQLWISMPVTAPFLSQLSFTPLMSQVPVPEVQSANVISKPASFQPYQWPSSVIPTPSGQRAPQAAQLYGGPPSFFSMPFGMPMRSALQSDRRHPNAPLDMPEMSNKEPDLTSFAWLCQKSIFGSTKPQKRSRSTSV
ncbi:unnamed protein product [Alopecurus aequalis]